MIVVEVENKKAKDLIEPFIFKILEKNIKYTIENATKIIWDDNTFDTNIWFEVEGSKSDIESIYDVDCVYLRGELRKRLGRTYIIKFGCCIENDNYTQYFTHYDRDENAWELYKSIYGEKLLVAKEKNELKYDNESSIEVSGDCCFNFNIKKYRYLENIILTGIIDEFTKNKLEVLKLSDEPYREYLLKKLQFCKKFHHSPYNISLMPKTGKLNNKKQQIANDRFDSFLWSLELLYAGNDALILTGDDNVVVDNRNELKKCLLSFKSVYDYCDFFYKGLDKKLIDKIIASGKCAINTPMRVHEYLNLAYEFWDKRKTCIPAKLLSNCRHHLFLEYTAIRNENYERLLE